MTAIKHDIDWSKMPEPWDVIGLQIATEIRRVASRELREQRKTNPNATGIGDRRGRPITSPNTDAASQPALAADGE